MTKNAGGKAFTVRLSYNIWKFLKVTSAVQERSMQDVINECVEKYRKRMENKLTDGDTMVS